MTNDGAAWLAVINSIVVIMATVPLAVQRWRDMIWNKKRKEAVDNDIAVESNENVDNDDASQQLDKCAKNFQKYSLDGQGSLGKGRLVLAVVKKYVAEHHNVKYGELRRIFPARLRGIKSETSFWGCVNLKDDAVRLYHDTGRGRYFIGEDETIVLEDGTKVVVTSQWGADNIDVFISEATKLGFKIEKI